MAYWQVRSDHRLPEPVHSTFASDRMIIHQGKMARAHKTSGKSTSSRKRPHPARAATSERASLTREIRRMSLILDHLVSAGLLAVIQRPNSRRIPLPEYAKVVAFGQADEVAEVRGRTGIVLDAQSLQGDWTYTVYFPAKQATFVLQGESLWDTGENVPEDVIYGGGETRNVRVDAEGNGTLVG
jgi:hypothetical protein